MKSILCLFFFQFIFTLYAKEEEEEIKTEIKVQLPTYKKPDYSRKVWMPTECYEGLRIQREECKDIKTKKKL